MKRYLGEALPEKARIALIANDALGNYAICTPLAQGLLHHNPTSTIDYFGGERTRELEEAAVGDLWRTRTSLFGMPFSHAVESAENQGPYDLVINIEISAGAKAFAALACREGAVCGPCMGDGQRGDLPFPDDETGDLWRDREWVSEDVTKTHSLLETGFIGEIFSKLAYIRPMPNAPWPGGLPRYRFASARSSIQMPSVLIATGASLPEKLWPMAKWIELLSSLPEPAGLLGAPPKRQAAFYHSQDSEDELVRLGLVTDLRGKLTLPEVVGALSGASLVITLDNGILHFAAASDAPTIGLYRPDIHRLWSPPNPNLTALWPSKNESVANIAVDTVKSAIQKKIRTDPAELRVD